MKKVTMYVTEAIRHKVSIDVCEDDIDSLEFDLKSEHADDYAGDYTSRETITDDDYELDDYTISEGW